MKYIFVSILMFLSMTIVVNAQQISLFDNQGEARAYIDYDEDVTIFMWDGTPVAFLEKDGSDICVFGFNGSFLGWFEEGIIFDKKGYAVGNREATLDMMARMERMKGMQKMSPLRPLTPKAPIKPMWKNSWSSTPLTEFLFFGKK